MKLQPSSNVSTRYAGRTHLFGLPRPFESTMKKLLDEVRLEPASGHTNQLLPRFSQELFFLVPRNI